MFECTPSRSAQVWDVFRNPHPWVIERWCAGIKGPPRQEVLSHNEGSGEVCCRALLHNLLLGKMVWRALYLWVLWRWFGGPCSYELHNTQSFNIAELLIFHSVLIKAKYFLIRGKMILDEDKIFNWLFLHRVVEDVFMFLHWKLMSSKEGEHSTFCAWVFWALSGIIQHCFIIDVLGILSVESWVIETFPDQYISWFQKQIINYHYDNQGDFK